MISFLPIMLMGILFGLAMDYEVFLVSRIREDYVHGGDARAAIGTGFAASAKVVTAAAVIMFAVFAAFVPEGEGPIKSIALRARRRRLRRRVHRPDDPGAGRAGAARQDGLVAAALAGQAAAGRSTSRARRWPTSSSWPTGRDRAMII